MLKENSADTKKKFKIKNIFDFHNDIQRLFLLMLCIFIILSVMMPGLFLTESNFSSIAFQLPEFGLISIAMMFAMLTGGIDLSIVSTANLCGVISGLIMLKLIPQNASTGYTMIIILISVLAAIFTGVLCGLFNGLVIVKAGIHPMLVTIGTMELYQGLCLLITKGTALYNFPDMFSYIGNGNIGIIPVPLIIFIAFIIISAIILNKTSFGFKTYMLGTNSTASRFSGINNKIVTAKVYAYSGLLASVAGLIIASRSNSAKADYGSSYTLQAMLVAVLGGTDPNGGFGKIAGLIMAILILQFLSTGFNMANISDFFKSFVWGAVLICVIVFNYFIHNKKSKVAKN